MTSGTSDDREEGNEKGGQKVRCRRKEKMRKLHGKKTEERRREKMGSMEERRN